MNRNMTNSVHVETKGIGTITNLSVEIYKNSFECSFNCGMPWAAPFEIILMAGEHPFYNFKSSKNANYLFRQGEKVVFVGELK